MVAHFRAVHNDAVADGDPAPDGHGLSRIGVNDAMILHIRVRPDCDPLVIAAQHRAEPDARTLQQSYLSDNHRVGRDPAIIRDFGFGTIQGVNRHRLLSALVASPEIHTAIHKKRYPELRRFDSPFLGETALVL